VELLSTLRSSGVEAVMGFGDRSFKAQMRRADASGAQVAVIIGDNEAAAREASVKPLRAERAQTRLALDVLPESLSQLLYSDDA